MVGWKLGDTDVWDDMAHSGPLFPTHIKPLTPVALRITTDDGPLPLFHF